MNQPVWSKLLGSTTWTLQLVCAAHTYAATDAKMSNCEQLDIFRGERLLPSLTALPARWRRGSEASTMSNTFPSPHLGKQDTNIVVCHCAQRGTLVGSSKKNDMADAKDLAFSRLREESTEILRSGQKMRFRSGMTRFAVMRMFFWQIARENPARSQRQPNHFLAVDLWGYAL